jgi:hypothetical protein
MPLFPPVTKAVLPARLLLIRCSFAVIDLVQALVRGVLTGFNSRTAAAIALRWTVLPMAPISHIPGLTASEPGTGQKGGA